jgi:hypothetical protein
LKTGACPVFCFTEQGELYAAYDRFSLKAVLDNKKIKKCVGVWPGKHETDCFPLNPENYRIAPPEEFRSIDNAKSIQVFYGKGQVFLRIVYTSEDGKGIKNTYTTEDKKLLDYIAKIGLRFSSVYE